MDVSILVASVVFNFATDVAINFQRILAESKNYGKINQKFAN